MTSRTQTDDDNNAACVFQKLEWVTPTISLMGAVCRTEGQVTQFNEANQVS